MRRHFSVISGYVITFKNTYGQLLIDLRLLAIALVVVFTAPPFADAEEFTCPDGDVECLVAAINAANANGEDDTIKLAEWGEYLLTAPDLKNGGPHGPTGLPSITSKIVIDGREAIIYRRFDAAPFRILHVGRGGNLTLDRIEIGGGYATGGVSPDQDCGGIFVAQNGRLTLNHSYVSFNASSFRGGGICTSPDSNVVLHKSLVEFNEAVNGGGIFNGFHATLKVHESFIQDNYADFGGGIFNDNGAVSNIVNSEIAWNQARRRGGGIGNFGFGPTADSGTRLTMSDSEVYGNYAGDGGGIYANRGVTEITASVFSDNFAYIFGSAVSNYSPSSFIINDSCIFPTSAGPSVYNETFAVSMDAKANWWGAPDGPSGVGPGSGASVSDNIDYEPFRTKVAAACGELAYVNQRVTLEPYPSSTFKTVKNTDGCPNGYVGKFLFDAGLSNISSGDLDSLTVEIATLTGGNQLLTAEGDLLGVFDTLPVPRSGDYEDGILSPGEWTDVPFTICLKTRRSFKFLVNVLGTSAQ